MEIVMMNALAWWRRATTAIAALGLVGIVACSQRTEDKAAQTGEAAKDTAASAADDAARATERAAEESREAAAEGSEKAKETGEAIAEKSRQAGQKADAAIDKTARTGDAAQQTLDIKSALLADSRVTAARIDVDTDANAKTVVLKGSVPNAGQRKTAEDIAMSKAPGYRVKNELTIVP
jgi:osmotically-inducible protein OsmY